MGWDNSNLHQFMHKKKYIGVPLLTDWVEMIDEKNVLVNEIFLKKGSKIEYEYDFGDSWTHDIVSLGKTKKGDPVFQVLGGAMECPPDDCGGIYGYYDMLDILSDPDREEHEGVSEWIGDDYDPEYFNKDELNEYVQDLMTID